MIHTFPAGDSTLETTVETLYVAGGEVRGSGGAVWPNSPTYQSLNSSRVTCNANPGVYVQGSGQEITRFCLKGPGTSVGAGDGENPNIGILMSHPEGTSGFAQGTNSFFQILLTGFDVGMQFGRENLGSWADTSEVNMFRVNDNDIAFRFKNHQSISNDIRNVFSQNDRIVFDVQAAGHTTFSNVAITNVSVGKTSTLIRTGQGTYINHHDGHLTINKFKIDTQAENRVKLLEQTDDSRCQVIFNGGTYSPAGDGIPLTDSLFDVWPRNALVLRDVKGLYPGCIKLLGPQAGEPINIEVDGGTCEAVSGFDTKLLIHASSTSRAVLTVQGLCQHRDGRVLLRPTYRLPVGAW